MDHPVLNDGAAGCWPQNRCLGRSLSWVSGIAGCRSLGVFQVFKRRTKFEEVAQGNQGKYGAARGGHSVVNCQQRYVIVSDRVLC